MAVVTRFAEAEVKDLHGYFGGGLAARPGERVTLPHPCIEAASCTGSACKRAALPEVANAAGSGVAPTHSARVRQTAGRAARALGTSTPCSATTTPTPLSSMRWSHRAHLSTAQPPPTWPLGSSGRLPTRSQSRSTLCTATNMEMPTMPKVWPGAHFRHDISHKTPMNRGAPLNRGRFSKACLRKPPSPTP